MISSSQRCVHHKNTDIRQHVVLQIPQWWIFHNFLAYLDLDDTCGHLKLKGWLYIGFTFDTLHNEKAPFYRLFERGGTILLGKNCVVGFFFMSKTKLEVGQDSMRSVLVCPAQSPIYNDIISEKQAYTSSMDITSIMCYR